MRTDGIVAFRLGRACMMWAAPGRPVGYGPVGSPMFAGRGIAVRCVLLIGLVMGSLVMMRTAPATAACTQQALGWIPYWDQKRAVRSFRQNSDVISHLSVFWYHLDRKGRVRPYTAARVDKDLVREAQAKRVKVLALVANLTDEEGVEEWDRERVRRMMADEARRQRHIGDLVALARDKGFDGINIDYEALRPEDRELFSTFIRELGAALRAQGKLLAVALHPRSSDPKDETNGSAAQDWQSLQRDADQLHIMTYGEHTAGDAAGPIASKAWVSRILDHATKDLAIDPGRIWLGVPLYAESWRESCGDDCESEDLTFADVAKIKAAAGSTLHRDEELAASYIRNRGGRTIWFEDAWSVAEKVAIARERGICRFAFWRLGGEDPEVWSALRKGAAP